MGKKNEVGEKILSELKTLNALMTSFLALKLSESPGKMKDHKYTEAVNKVLGEVSEILERRETNG